MTALSQFIQKHKLLEYSFFLLIFCFPIQLGKHFWPSWSYLHGVRLDYLSPTLYLTDILSLVVIILGSITLYKTSLYKFSPRSLVLGAFLLVSTSISIALSSNPFFGWYEIIKGFEFVCLFLVAKNLFKDKKILSTSIVILVVSLFLQIALASYQVFFAHSAGGLFWLLGERTFDVSTPGIARDSLSGVLLLRGYGTFAHPNVFAGYVVIVGIAAWFLFGESRLRSALLSLLSLGLLVSMSRFPLLLWVTFLTTVSRGTGKILFGSLFVLFIGLLLLFNPLSDPSLAARFVYVQDVFYHIQKYPLFGMGFGNFLALPARLEAGIGLPQPVHNVFLLILDSLGIVGFSLVLVVLFKTFQTAKKDRMSLLLFLAWIALGSFDHYLLSLQQGQLLTTLVFALIWRENTV